MYRPAAIKQLETLADEVGARFEPSTVDERPVDIVNRALKNAKTAFSDVLLVDTAGRLAIDEEMMAEISALHKAINPVETLFVIDAMTGQDAVNTATAFDRAWHYRCDPDQGRRRHPRRCRALSSLGDG